MGGNGWLPYSLLLLRIAEAERDDVFVAHQWPQSFEIRQQLRAVAGREREIHRRRLAVRIGLGLIEIGVPVDEQQSVAAAPAQRERAAEKNRTIAAEQDWKLVALHDVGDGVRELHRILGNSARIERQRLWIALRVVGGGGYYATGATRVQLVCQAVLEQHGWQSIHACRLETEDRWRFDDGVAIHCAREQMQGCVLQQHDRLAVADLAGGDAGERVVERQLHHFDVLLLDAAAVVHALRA